jgi:hypothetical protein
MHRIPGAVEGAFVSSQQLETSVVACRNRRRSDFMSKDARPRKLLPGFAVEDHDLFCSS